MTILDYPRCRRHSLSSNGAFWACGMCRYAITQTALLTKRRATEPGNDLGRPAIGQSVTRHTNRSPRFTPAVSRFTGSERAPMINRRQHRMQEELGVLISLAVSLGMIILTVVGWWLWGTFPGLMGAVMSVSSVEIP